MLSQLITWVEGHWGSIEKFFNSNAFTAIAGAFAGAWAGAYIAQRIAERKKGKEELLKEIRNTNAAIMTALSIFEAVSALKRQHVKPLKERYDRIKKAFLDFAEMRDKGQVPKDAVFEYQVDFVTLSPFPLPLEVLTGQLFERLSVRGRTIRCYIVLSQVADSLKTFIEKRNEIIDGFKAKSGSAPPPPTYYFGLPGKEGHINEDYPSAMAAIARYTDDSIYFSHVLCTELLAHGEALVKKFKREFSDSPPVVVEVDFDKAKDMLPGAESYKDWVDSFVEKPTPTSRMRNFVKKLRYVLPVGNRGAR